MKTLEEITFELIGQYPDGLFDSECNEVVNIGYGSPISNGKYTAVFGSKYVYLVYEDGTLSLED